MERVSRSTFGTAGSSQYATVSDTYPAPVYFPTNSSSILRYQIIGTFISKYGKREANLRERFVPLGSLADADIVGAGKCRLISNSKLRPKLASARKLTEKRHTPSDDPETCRWGCQGVVASIQREGVDQA